MSDTQALRDLLARATPGPWRIFYGYDGAQNIAQMRSTDRTVSVVSERVISTKRADVPPWERTMENAALIAAAVNALPALLAEIDALRRVADAAADFEAVPSSPNLRNALRAALKEIRP